MDTSQEAIVTVEGTVTRLAPCGVHAQDPPGTQQPRRNANGYDHDCAQCAATPPIIEALEGVTHE